MFTLAERARAAARPVGGGDELLLPADLALGGLPAIQLAARDAAIISHGQSVVTGEGGAGMVRLYGPGGRFLGIGEVGAGGHVVPRRLWQARSEGQDAEQAVTDP
ncbi:MAG: tRNA pseudouridine(55) synthase TruB [Gammaproteobacteria bacterium]|nr:tRNA pseudouridine(55) synthase TruB [Gammaproteobacteria bacterium]